MNDGNGADIADGAAGIGSVAALAQVARSLTGDGGHSPRVLLVVSSGFAGRPWRDGVLAALRALAPETVAHDGMPTPHSVAALARHAARCRPDVIAAVGGGSVLDAAKCAAVLAGHEAGAILDAAAVRAACASGVSQAGIPVVAVPTTPGTGAEATPFATVWDREAGRKLSLRGPGVRPAAVILDPGLLAGLPRGQLASCALDTLAQAMEAMWSTGADDRARRLGAAALAHCGGLADRVAAAAGEESRRALLLAGHYAGQAIAVAGTTLCHALSYPITLRYGLPHGHACGLTLARVAEFNAAVDDGDCADPRGAGQVRAAVAAALAALGAAGPAELAQIVTEVMAAGGLRPAPGLRAGAVQVAAAALSYDRAGNNPRRPAPDQAAAIVTAAAADFSVSI